VDSKIQQAQAKSDSVERLNKKVAQGDPRLSPEADLFARIKKLAI